jgi:hypothetical protein
MLLSMEFNTLLEHFGRSGYNVSEKLNLFMNSKKQIVLRYKLETNGYSWYQTTNYKFKMPSTIDDVSSIIHVANSIERCGECKVIYSIYEHPTCPECAINTMIKKAQAIKSECQECSLCGSKCIKGLIGNLEKIQLGCTHEMCRSCLSELKRSGSKFYSVDNTVMTTITCPFCRQKENVS